MNIISSFFLVIYRILNALYCIVFLGLIVGLIFFYNFLEDNTINVKNNSILIIRPKGELLEQRQANLFSSDFYNETYTRDIVKAITLASNDNKIKGVVMDLSYFSGGSTASLAEVKRAMKDFSHSNKFFLAYSSSFTKGGYVLATGANEIWMDAMGEVSLDGLGIETLYYKDAMDKFGVKAYVSRTGSFKAAVEPFLSNRMNEENREVVSNYLNDTWNWILQTISVNRDIDIDLLKDYPANRLMLLNRAGGSSSNLALQFKFIDKIGSKYDFIEYIETVMTTNNAVVNYIDYNNYIKSSSSNNSKKQKGDEIAIIYATGIITNSSGAPSTINGEALANLISEVTEKNSVVAIVIRLDTGGGDAYASELIYRAITQARREKPVLISMAGMAASGGYWLSLAADEIWAEEATLTGSIGVFSTFFTITELMDKYGLRADSVKTSSSFYEVSPYQEPNSQFIELMDADVADKYRIFLERVVDARRASSVEEAHKLAQGRIYSGIKAQEIGLVDAIGGLNKVVIRAAQLAQTTKYYESIYEVTYSPLELSIERMLQMNMVSPSFKNLISTHLESRLPASRTILALEPMKLMIR